MQHWTLTEPRQRFRPLEPEPPAPDFGDGPPPRGLLLTCTGDCFDPRHLDGQLAPGAWRIHRTMGSILPPFGSEHQVEETLLEQAASVWKVRQIVVCGHWPCRTIERLVSAQPFADDFLLRHLQSYAEAVRCIVAGQPRTRDLLREACEHNVRVQINHLRTYPAVAAALEGRDLQILPWLHDDTQGELFYPSSGRGRFDRYAALNPDQNSDLSGESIRRRRPRPPLGGMEPERLYLA